MDINLFYESCTRTVVVNRFFMSGFGDGAGVEHFSFGHDLILI